MGSSLVFRLEGASADGRGVRTRGDIIANMNGIDETPAGGLRRVGLGDYLQEQMDQAIREVGMEWKIAERWEKRQGGI
jgi:hypothetical protein